MVFDMFAKYTQISLCIQVVLSVQAVHLQKP